jgi:hypothetical protein
MEKFSQKKEEISHGKEKFTPKMGKIIPNFPTKMENRSQIFPKNRQLLNRHFSRNKSHAFSKVVLDLQICKRRMSCNNFGLTRSSFIFVSMILSQWAQQ